jgi:transposase
VTIHRSVGWLGFYAECDQTNRPEEVLSIMRALDREVTDAVWAAVQPLLPAPSKRHPLGCHRPRVPDRVVFRGILIRLITGSSWETTEQLLDHEVSDTTMRARRDEWIQAGVFEHLMNEAIAAFDRIIGLELSETAVDGSLQKAPCGGEGTGPNPCDRGKRGWKWSMLTEANGIPLGFEIDGANRQDMVMLAPTLDDVNSRGLLVEIGTMRLDRGYDNAMVRGVCAERGLTDVDIAKKRKTRSKRPRKAVRQHPGPRWVVERTNSWLTNYGQMRRNTDRSSVHRLAQLHLVCVLLIVIKLIDWRNRWSPIR